jgi:hypothetical protein
MDFSQLDLSKLKLNTQDLDAIPLSDEHEELIQKVGAVIDSTLRNSNLVCNEECRNNKKEQELYNAYQMAKNTMIDAPHNLEDAERKYMTFKEGDVAYQRTVEKKLKGRGEEMAKLINDNYLENMKQVQGLLDKYADQTIYNEHIGELANDYSDKLSNLEERTEDEQSKMNIANRETYYKTQQLQVWKAINDFVLNIVRILAAFYVVLVIAYKQYDKRVHIIGMILMLGFSTWRYVYSFIWHRL